MIAGAAEYTPKNRIATCALMIASTPSTSSAPLAVARRIGEPAPEVEAHHDAPHHRGDERDRHRARRLDERHRTHRAEAREPAERDELASAPDLVLEQRVRHRRQRHRRAAGRAADLRGRSLDPLDRAAGRRRRGVHQPGSIADRLPALGGGTRRPAVIGRNAICHRYDCIAKLGDAITGRRGSEGTSSRPPAES